MVLEGTSGKKNERVISDGRVILAPSRTAASFC